MDIEDIRQFCLSLPYATESIKWGNDLVFCVGEKMFTVVVLEQTEQTAMSFKCTPEKFAELIEMEGIFPAPYVARYHWVGLERLDILEQNELEDLIKNSHTLVWEKLPKNVRKYLSVTP